MSDIRSGETAVLNWRGPLLATAIFASVFGILLLMAHLNQSKTSRMPKTLAKMAVASRGPRQFSTAVSPERMSDMVEQLPLALAIRSDHRLCQRVRSIPDAIEYPQATA